MAQLLIRVQHVYIYTVHLYTPIFWHPNILAFHFNILACHLNLQQPQEKASVS